MDAPLWQPSADRVKASNMTAFMRWLRAERGLTFERYEDLYTWSIDDIAGFWDAVWDFGGVIGEKHGPAPASFPRHGSTSPRT